MSHPTQEELRELKTLINTHAALLEKHLEEEAQCISEVERGPELVKAEITMAEALLAQSYEPREGPENRTGFITFPTVYCVHSYYLHAFDNGRYDPDTGTWSTELGDVPEWALLQLYPPSNPIEKEVPPDIQEPLSTGTVVMMWLRRIICRHTNNK